MLSDRVIGMKILEGKIALVTGTSRGIGKCIAEELAQNGAVVYANARREGCLDEWARQLNQEKGTMIKPVYFDVTDSEKVRKEIFEIWKKTKKIDILVNNAGVEYNENIGMLKKEHISEMFAVNTIATIEITQLVAKFMMRNNSGSVINIASVVAQFGASGQSVYSATKGAVVSFTKSAAKELGKYKIRVNAVAPGLNDTDMIKETDEEYLKKRINNVSLGRIGKPKDVANSVVFLASDMAEYISGQVIGIDGAVCM